MRQGHSMKTNDNFNEKLLEITLALSGQRNVKDLYDQIVSAAQYITGADGATLYTVQETENSKVLSIQIIRNNTLNTYIGGSSGNKIQLQPIKLFNDDGSPNRKNVSAATVHDNKLSNIADIYNSTDYDFTGAKTFDKTNGYLTKSMLTVPLVNHAGDAIGALQLVNATHNNEIISFDPELEHKVQALASSAAIALDNQNLIQGHKDLLNAFIKTIAKAIDAKSSHTSGHCQRVPEITQMLAKAACETNNGALAGFSLDEEGWYELQVAAWLHDCGKLSTPDVLLDKSTKLHIPLDGIEIIKARFAAAISQTQLRATQCSNDSDYNALMLLIDQLREECKFLEQANIGSEFMDAKDQERVKDISRRTWVDVNGNMQAMLTPEEIDYLCISRGTLSAEERQRINDHIVVTIDMLESLPFPKQLQRVPEYAGGHHEKYDGTGYPKGLTGPEMSWPARMMAIADVFEALTARDRPYKQPMKLTQALSILKSMTMNGHLDPDLYRIFINKKVWLDYANKFLLPEQLDISDASDYLLD